MNEGLARDAFDRAIAEDKQEFGSFFLSRFLGMAVSYENDACLVTLDIQDFLFNPQGSLHGGVIALAMDVSMGHLIRHTTGSAAATLDINVQYARPARQGVLHIRGEFSKRGREICFLRSQAHDDDGKLVAFATATWKIPGAATS